LTRPLPSEATSKGRDKPLTQVEAIVRRFLYSIIYSSPNTLNSIGNSSFIFPVLSIRL